MMAMVAAAGCAVADEIGPADRTAARLTSSPMTPGTLPS
jgi:hypothetical protein